MPHIYSTEVVLLGRYLFRHTSSDGYDTSFGTVHRVAVSFNTGYPTKDIIGTSAKKISVCGETRKKVPIRKCDSCSWWGTHAGFVVIVPTIFLFNVSRCNPSPIKHFDYCVLLRSILPTASSAATILSDFHKRASIRSIH